MPFITLLLSFGACVLLAACGDSFPAYTVNDPKDPNTTWKTLQPLPYNEAVANGHCPIVLPKEARNIQFVDFYAGLSGFDHWVRFEAPVEICRAHARQILDTFNSKLPAGVAAAKNAPEPLDLGHAQSLARMVREQVEPVARAPWFDSDTIRKGESWGEGGSRIPEILINLREGIFYYHFSD